MFSMNAGCASTGGHCLVCEADAATCEVCEDDYVLSAINTCLSMY